MKTVDTYLTHVSPPQKAELERIRTIVKRIVPDAEEVMSYGMPAFKYKEQPLVYFAAFKNHMSLFPTSGPPETLKHKLTGYKTSKGTIRFTIEKTLPDSLIEEILITRLAEIARP